MLRGPFSRKFEMKISVLLQPVGLPKLMLNLFGKSDIQVRELCSRDFMKYTFDIVVY